MGLRYFSVFFLLSLATFLSAQPDPDFQQEVRYDISVLLNDSLHTLSGRALEVYINHSPDTLYDLYFHLWPNAYQSTETAFAQQQNRQGTSRFLFADPDQGGGFSEILFYSEGKLLQYTETAMGPDVVLLHLAEPLLPGDSVKLEIPFTLDIPASFSRLGHVRESYQLTQWYPKPAVYDQNGWHPMPYLDQGEFYSEFGHFSVEITLPENYLVAATGVLQDSSEIAFLQEQERDDRAYLEKYDPAPIPLRFTMRMDTFPASSPRMKTIRYRADQVHDFAWFADKRFRVLSRKITLPSGRQIDGYVFFTQVQEGYWKEALDYLEQSTIYYSQGVGEYPWPQVTAVQSALSAGAGMEYPMITVIGLSGSAQALDEVITHEVGHNWFYGILASNERDHPWMDEGLNSYYDHRYTEDWYSIPMGDYYLPEWLARHSDIPFYNLAYLYFSRSGREQSPGYGSDELSPGGYYLAAYEKPALAFRHLQGYWGRAKIDSAMHAYFQEWSFRHPGPDDLEASFEQFAAEDLDWLFSGFLGSSRTMDYTIRRVKTRGDSLQVLIENRGDIPAPFPLALESKGTAGDPIWLSGFSGRKWVTLADEGAEAIHIDPEFETLDFHPDNNRRWIRNNLAGLRDVRLAFGTGLEHSRNKYLYWVPLVGWNDYDKWMFGLGLHNYTILEKQVEFAVLPAYSFVSREVNGVANLQFNVRMPDESPFRRFRLSASHRRFSEDYSYRNDYRLRYQRSSLAGELFLKSRIGTSDSRSIYLRVDGISEDRARFTSEGFTGIIQDNGWFVRLGYAGERTSAIHDFGWRAEAEYKAPSNHSIGYDPYVKTSAELIYDYTYQRSRKLHVRLFGAGFIQHSFRASNLRFPWSIDLTAQGAGDYLYEGYYFGRSDQSGIWWRQRSTGEGGFYATLPPAYRNLNGTSDHFLIAMNLMLDLPKPLPRGFPIRPFANLAYSAGRKLPSGTEPTDRIWWEAGLRLSILDGALGISLPIFVSPQLRSLFDQNGQSAFYRRLSFTFDLHRLNPIEMREIIGM